MSYARRGSTETMHGISVAVGVVLVVLAVLPGRLHAYPDEVVVVDVDTLEEGSSCHFPVTAPVVPESPEARREHYLALEAKDFARHRQMAAATRRRQLASDMPELMSATSGLSTFELPMRSGMNVVNVGMYLVTVRFGTPALPYSMALDTANDLTWLNCRLRGQRRHRGKAKTISVAPEGEEAPIIKSWYRPARSSSWRRYRCSQRDSCGVFPHNTCQNPDRNESCSYDQVYEDGTVTRGIYGRETATVAVSGGRQARLPGLVLGCSTYEAGGSVDAHDGVLTLGNQDVSFGTMAARHFQGRFSFCLMAALSGRDASSYLTFGPNPAMAVGAVETPLVYNPLVPAFGVGVTGVYVEGKRLDIPPEVWDHGVKGGGLNLDTGTSLTSLVEPAYGAVTKALDKQLQQLEKVTDVVGGFGFEYCYKWSSESGSKVAVPKLVVALDGGGRLEPSSKGVLLPEVTPGVACLGFRRREIGMGPSILGNVHMQEHIWEFDHLKEKLRFKKDQCQMQHPAR